MFKILILNIFFPYHPVHVTMTAINQVPESDILKVFFRMYYDDSQLDYKQYYPDFKFGKNNDTTDYPRQKLNKYFNDKVRIYVNNKILTGKLSDVSINSYEILLNLIYQSDKKPRNFRIMNQILTGIYTDQANFVYLDINNYTDAVKLIVDSVEETINLK